LQILVLILLLSAAFAQDNCNLDLEKECISSICTIYPDNLVVADPNMLLDKIKDQPFTMDPALFAKMDELVNRAKETQAILSKKANEKAFAQFADSIISDPERNVGIINGIFAGDFKCIIKDHHCDLVANDFSEYPEEMKTFYRKFKDLNYLSDLDANFASTHHLKKALLESLEAVKTELPPKEYLETQKSISGLRTPTDLTRYKSAAWFQSYKKKIPSQLAPFQDVLAKSLIIKAKKELKTNLSNEKLKAELFNSCKVASYVKDDVLKRATPERYEEMKAKVVSAYKTKFLPKLSAHSAKLMGLETNSKLFKQVEISSSIFPGKTKDSPSLPTMNTAPRTPENLLDAFITYKNNLVDISRFRCNIEAYEANDHLQMGIWTSPYAIAYGGYDILAHELGHWVSNAMAVDSMSAESKKKFMALRKCIRSMYPTFPDTHSLEHSYDAQWTNEDFGDWFAAYLDVGTRNLYCEYENMTGNLKASFYIPTGANVHSPTLFRALHYRMNKGEKIPPKCQEVIDSHPEIQIKKCSF
jgi:hypothetical protein